MNSRKIEEIKNPIYLQNKELYSNSMTAPPAESMGHVIQFELTEGCSWGKCSFCDMPKGSYKIKTIEEYKNHVNNVWNNVKNKKNIERIFIGSENALSANTKLLQDALTYTVDSFKKNTHHLPRRITIYGNTKDIISKKDEWKSGRSALRFLNCGGICGDCSIDRFGKKIGLGYIYWGIESGDNNTLDYIQKGYNENEILEANKVVERAGLKKSVTIIPGLGGIKFADSHLEKTLRVLNRIEPTFITLIGINPNQKTSYFRRINKETLEKTNRPLTQRELAEQTISFLEGINFSTTIGCFNSEIQKFGYNPLPFGSITVKPWSREKDIKVQELKKQLNDKFPII